MNTPITESQVVAYLAERAKYLQSVTNSQLATVAVEAYQHGKEAGFDSRISFRLYTHEHGSSLTDCRTLEEGIQRLAAIASPDHVAARLREQAKDLLAQAAALEAAAATPMS